MKTQTSSTRLDVFKHFEIVNTNLIKGGNDPQNGNIVTDDIAEI